MMNCFRGTFEEAPDLYDRARPVYPRAVFDDLIELTDLPKGGRSTFETWKPFKEPFDAVVAFTAFHWIDPDVRFKKAAEILREAGALAVVTTKHVRVAAGDEFWVGVQEDYTDGSRLGPMARSRRRIWQR